MAVFTFKQVAEHDNQKDLYLVVGDKVYDATKFVEEHPGGEEVLLEVAGKDATEAFEDVGHSDEALETLELLCVGDLKRLPGDPKPTSKDVPVVDPPQKQSRSGLFSTLFSVVGGIAAFLAYSYLQEQQKQGPTAATASPSQARVA